MYIGIGKEYIYPEYALVSDKDIYIYSKYSLSIWRLYASDINNVTTKTKKTQ